MTSSMFSGCPTGSVGQESDISRRRQRETESQRSGRSGRQWGPCCCWHSYREDSNDSNEEGNDSGEDYNDNEEEEEDSGVVFSIDKTYEPNLIQHFHNFILPVLYPQPLSGSTAHMPTKWDNPIYENNSWQFTVLQEIGLSGMQNTSHSCSPSFTTTSGAPYSMKVSQSVPSFRAVYTSELLHPPFWIIC